MAWKENMTQEEYNSEIAKLNSAAKDRYSKNTVSKKDYQELESKYDTLTTENEYGKVKPSIDKHFKELGGKENGYKDFIASNRDKLMATGNLGQTMKTLAKEKPYFFDAEAKSSTVEQELNVGNKGNESDGLDPMPGLKRQF